MKVLVVSTPLSGHLGPLLPLVEALVSGGDEVVVSTGADAAPTVERSGARFSAAGAGDSVWFERLRDRTRGNPGDGIAPERINHYFVPRLFAEIAAADMIDDVLACGRDLEPDLVIFENYALAGPLAAELLGVPGVTQLVGPMPDHDVYVLANDAVSPLWRSFGCDVPGFAGVYRDLTIEICPPSLEPIEVPRGEVLALRPSPLADPAATAPRRPLVYVTFGTFFNENLDLFRVVLEALTDEPLDIVMTVGNDQDPAALSPFPPNARVERFIPQATVLPECAAVVHHGGAGTTFGALAHGVPQVIIPQGADNFDHAAMCTRAGSAMTILPDHVDPTTVANAVRRVLHEPGYAVAARKTADEIDAMPGPDSVADALRAYARRRTTNLR
jgi:UDP:flavonoid glycosyltransferase YjiC (YdhE family)